MRTYTLLKIHTAMIKDADLINVMRHGDITKPANELMYEAVALIEATDAEDAFDVDNNVMREEERDSRVVDFIARTNMTVGDVLVDNASGIYYVCMPRGWQIVSGFEFLLPQISGRLASSRSDAVSGDVSLSVSGDSGRVNNFPIMRKH